jgi:hypothetical protein
MSIAQTPRIFRPARAFLLVACLSGVAGISGCVDDGDDVMASLVAPEAGTALELTVDLPSVATLAAEEDLEGRLGRSSNRWLGSWDLPLDQGRAIRSQVNREASIVLADRLTGEDLQAHLGAVSLGLELTRALDPAVLPLSLRGALAHAEAHRDVARTHLATDDRASAIFETLQASDALKEVSPASVATSLLTRGEEALRREQAAGSYSQEDLARARRLLDGARTALEDGDPLRAIRRGYYACRLLSVEIR